MLVVSQALIVDSFYEVTSRKVTNAKESATDRTISDCLVKSKVFWVMTLSLYGQLTLVYSA